MLAVQTAVAAHDTTGGMSTKIAEAASIAAMGIDVFIVEVITATTDCFHFQFRSSNFLSLVYSFVSSFVCFLFVYLIMLAGRNFSCLGGLERTCEKPEEQESLDGYTDPKRSW